MWPMSHGLPFKSIAEKSDGTGWRQLPFGPTDGLRGWGSVIKAGHDQIKALGAAGCVAYAILPFILASGSMPIHS